MEELALGGNISGAVRVGATVRRRGGYWTPAVHALLEYLAQRGFEAPRPLGTDERGREVLSWVDGEAVPGWPDPFPDWIYSPDCMRAAARGLRRFHDLVEGFSPPPGAAWRMPAPGPHDIICHNDWAPYNAVFRARRPDVMVDWDMASPGTRLWDAAWSAYMWIPLHPHLEGYSPQESAGRVRAFCADYGDLSPVELLDTLLGRLRFSADFARAEAAAGDPGFQKLVDELDAPGQMERNAEGLERDGVLRRLLARGR
ncbi:MAG TPA: phosphotransferase [Candidatus Limnocylindria bacterium]|nr:phosphotransferase [Candidatus Limnocylindria bacterium]